MTKRELIISVSTGAIIAFLCIFMESLEINEYLYYGIAGMVITKLSQIFEVSK